MNKNEVVQSGEFNRAGRSVRNFESKLTSLRQLMIDLNLDSISANLSVLDNVFAQIIPDKDYGYYDTDSYWEHFKLIAEYCLRADSEAEGKAKGRPCLPRTHERASEIWREHEPLVPIHRDMAAGKYDGWPRESVENVLSVTTKGSEFLFEWRNLKRAFDADLTCIKLLQLEPTEVLYYEENSAVSFDKSAVTKFNVEVDATEAAKCYALTCYTASVFHTMRVIECMVQQIGARFFPAPVEVIKYGKVVPIDEACWDEILTAITNKLGKHTKAGESVQDSRMREICVSLDSIRGIWRNPVAHPRYHYSKEESRSIFGLSREVAKQIAQII